MPFDGRRRRLARRRGALRAEGLSARGLCKRWRNVVGVAGVDVDVRPGEVHGLLGPNGAGKTTVFRMLAGVEMPDAGEVWLDGVALGQLPLHRRAQAGLGYLPQDDCLFVDLDVAANVGIAARLGVDVGGCLTLVGLDGFGPRRISGLSGGERRRVAIARLLALKPRVLLLDEPFAGVDPVAVQAFGQLVRALAETGVGVLITDHAARETLALCDRVTLLDAGVVQVVGSPAEVAADPRARDRYLGRDFLLPAVAIAPQDRYDPS